MIDKVLFATGNPRKLAEARSVAERHGIEVEAVKLELDEIQHTDPVKVTAVKVKAAYRILGKPVVVHDTSWSIPTLRGFPGAYMHDVAKWLKAQDWLSLMEKYQDKTIVIYENVFYCDGNDIKSFQYRQEGHFVNEPRGESRASIDEVVTFRADGLTIAEARAGHEGQSVQLKVWEDFFGWLTCH